MYSLNLLAVSKILELPYLYMVAAAAVGPGPYATCGCGSPGAMKFVCGFFSAFAAEHRAMVGELA